MLIGRRRDVGLAGDLDYLQADGAFQTARAETANLARSLAGTENALRLLVVLPRSPPMAASWSSRDWSPTWPWVCHPDSAGAAGCLAAEQKLIAANANIAPRVLLSCRR